MKIHKNYDFQFINRLSTMAHALPAFPAFDVEGDQHGLNLRWQEYIERLQNFLLALNIKDDTRKRAMLLHLAGEGVYRTFKTLPDTGEPKDFEKSVEKLTGYFAPKQNKECERYMFRQAQQDSAEILDAFHTRLKTNDGYIAASLKIEQNLGACHHLFNCFDIMSGDHQIQ